MEDNSEKHSLVFIYQWKDNGDNVAYMIILEVFQK